jgi:hypothetical protein
MGPKEFGSLLITDCTIAVNMWGSQPEEKVSPQTLYFKGSLLLSFPLFLLLLSPRNHSQLDRLSLPWEMQPGDGCGVCHSSGVCLMGRAHSEACGWHCGVTPQGRTPR